MKRRFFRALVALVFVPLISNCAWASTYQFIKIADTTTAAPVGAFSNLGAGIDPAGDVVDASRFFTGRPPAISGSTVAFYGRYGGNHGIFAGDGGPLVTIVKTGDAAPSGTFNLLSDMTIDDGTVAFLGKFALPNQPNQSGVFTGNGGPLTVIAKSGATAPSGEFVGVANPSISGTGIVFSGTDSAGAGVFRSGTGPIAAVLREGDGSPFGTITSVFDAASNENAVAFFANTSDDRGIFTISEGTVKAIVRDGDVAPSGFFGALFHPAISASHVAFRGRFAPGLSQTGIFSGDGGPLTTIAKTGDAAPSGTFTAFSEPAISGTAVAFRALYGGGDGIFVGDGGPLSTVIKSGDPLFGSTVLGVGLGRFGFDPHGSGNLAFAYALTDGRLGIAIASPVPEPGFIALCAILTGTAVVVLRRHPSRERFSC